MTSWLQDSASIQPRTNPPEKFAMIRAREPRFGIVSVRGQNQRVFEIRKEVSMLYDRCICDSRPLASDPISMIVQS